MLDPGHVHHVFAAALLDPSLPVPAVVRGAARRRAERRFAVYRNNLLTGLTSALVARFPVVQRFVGDDFFREMARVYVTAMPPRSPVMLRYGETFPAFIDAFEPAAPIPYLGDVARLEMARGRAYHASDAVPVRVDTFASCPRDRLAGSRVKLHPSVSIISSRHPVYSIWYANQDPDRYVPIAPWASESALVARPDLEVDVWRLPPGGAPFLSALSRGCTFADAFSAALKRDETFEPVANLSLLIRARIVVALNRRARAK